VEAVDHHHIIEARTGSTKILFDALEGTPQAILESGRIGWLPRRTATGNDARNVECVSNRREAAYFRPS
jgi:hypothetical protein